MREQHGPIKEQHGPISDNQNKHSFGNYDLVRRIDVGGMGEVYLAHQRTAFGREVAVKIIRSDLVHDLTARKRFLREAEVSSHLKHEHILPLFEFGEEQGRLFLVTPYIESGTLGQRLQQGPLSLSEVHQLFAALVQAIAYIHKRGVIHRDLKPSNILLDKEDSTGQLYVRLIDFGIASLPGIVENAPLTSAGHEIGTLAYMAPERLDGIAAPSNDIYSLGIILYQMLTGQIPEQGYPVKLPPALDAVMQRCIAHDPADRFANADELLKAFEQAHAAVRTQPRSQAPVVPTTPTPSGATPNPSRPPVAPEPDSFNIDGPVRTATSRPVARPDIFTTDEPAHMATSRPVARQEKVRPEMAPTPLSRPDNPFSHADYSAQTASIDPASLQARRLRQLDDTTTIGKKPPELQGQQGSQGKKRKVSVFTLVPLSIVVVLLIIALIIFMAVPALATASVTLTPQAHAMSNTFTLNAKTGLQSPNIASASIPIQVLTINRTLSKTGPTSGKTLECILFTLNCKKTVSDNDVTSLVLQIKQGMQTQIAQDVSTQLQAKNAVQIGTPDMTIVNDTVDPAVGTKSDTVTVTLTEQAKVHYVLNADAQSVARALLKQQVQQQLGVNYALLDQLTQVSQTTVKTANPDNSTATLSVAAGGVAQYSFPASQLNSIPALIKGMKLQNARAILAKQAGLDAKTLGLTISYGDTLPGDVHQITVHTVNPTNLPSVQMPK